MIKHKCNLCHGQKFQNKMHTLDVVVERGIPNGHAITFEMESHHVMDGYPGDVRVVLTEKKHKDFVRNGNNL